jgi:L-rhamnose mutarotase
MKRYGQVVRLKPEKRTEYLRHHGGVWPGVLKTIAGCNIRNYSMFEHGEVLFASPTAPCCADTQSHL